MKKEEKFIKVCDFPSIGNLEEDRWGGTRKIPWYVNWDEGYIDKLTWEKIKIFQNIKVYKMPNSLNEEKLTEILVKLGGQFLYNVAEINIYKDLPENIDAEVYRNYVLLGRTRFYKWNIGIKIIFVSYKVLCFVRNIRGKLHKRTTKTKIKESKNEHIKELV